MENINSMCRLCDQNGDYNIFEHNLMLDDGQFLISSALQMFSDIKV